MRLRERIQFDSNCDNNYSADALTYGKQKTRTYSSGNFLVHRKGVEPLTFGSVVADTYLSRFCKHHSNEQDSPENTGISSVFDTH